jgi:transcriptional regulator with XRE-family HTH domain
MQVNLASTLFMMSIEPELCKMAIGKIWRRVRRSKQLNRAFVAQALGVSKSNIDKIEQCTQHVRLADVIRYCEVIGYSPEEFVRQVMNVLPPPLPKKVNSRWAFYGMTYRKSGSPKGGRFQQKQNNSSGRITAEWLQR